MELKKNEIVVLFVIIVFVILYIQPYSVVKYTNTIIGRVVLMALLVLASLYHSFAGVIMAMAIVLLTDTSMRVLYEGMEGIKGNVTSDLLSSTSEPNKNDLNMLDNSTSGASIIGDLAQKPFGSARTDLQSSSSSSVTFSNVPSTANFRKNHCKTKPGSSTQIFVDEKGKEMKMADIKKKYPLNFTNGIDCNPCDDTCSYTITDSVEQIHNEENLRSKQASTFM
jgi:hypothetical protein